MERRAFIGQWKQDTMNMDRREGLVEGLVGVVLAAGASRRMGQPKGLLLLEGSSLLEQHIGALGKRVVKLRVVLGAEKWRYEAALIGLRATDSRICVLENPDWATTGPRESLSIALDGLHPDSLALVTPVDVAPAPQVVIDALLRAGAPAVPTWEGRAGHPVLVAVGPTGRALQKGNLQEALKEARQVAVDWPDLDWNLNTPADWDAFVSRRSGRP